jgi:rubrerythrin
MSEPESPEVEHRPRIDAALEAELYPFCGFLSIEDARQAREELRASGIPADILIREGGGEESGHEEFWIRVPRRRFAEVAEVLQEDAADEAENGNGELAEGETFACSECGEDVAAEADVCPHCGARFDA